MLSANIPLPVLLLPLLLFLALPLLAAGYNAPGARKAAAQQMLAVMVLSLLTSLLMIRLQAKSDVITTSRLVATSLVMLVSGIAAAPLLDRARSGGLLIGAVLAGVLSLPLLLHALLPNITGATGVLLVYATLTVGALVGLGGSVQLPLSPSRFTLEGHYRARHIHAVMAGMGWLLLTATLALLQWSVLPPLTAFNPLPLLLSAGLAALLVLLRTRAAEALHKAGEALCAGLILAIGAPYSLAQAALLGVCAGIMVLRTEAWNASLRVDDPTHLSGALLLPAFAGILTSVLLGYLPVATGIEWAGICLTVGAVAACLVWPLIKLTLGLRRV